MAASLTGGAALFFWASGVWRSGSISFAPTGEDEPIDKTIPYSALDWADGGASIKATGDSDPDMLGALLTRVVREQAAKAAGAKVEPISVTIDVTGRTRGDEAISFAANIDRKTRTIVFAGGEASTDAATVMTATAVYRILPDSPAAE